jgi:lauroyl/myristoyl acyltransferase
VKRSPALFGILFALMLGGTRRTVRETLRWVHGPRAFFTELRDVFRTFVAYARCLTESLAADRPEAAQATIRVSGESILKRALAEGRGVVVLTAHVGPWDGAAAALSRELQADVLIAMAEEPDAGARVLQDALRAKTGVRVAHVGANALDGLALLEQLKRGGVVAAQLDRGAPSGRGLEVRLFGRPFQVPEGPFRLAAKREVPLVPLFARRLGYYDYALSVGEPILLTRASDREGLRAAAQRAADAMQAAIAACPTQWFRFG